MHVETRRFVTASIWLAFSVAASLSLDVCANLCPRARGFTESATGNALRPGCRLVRSDLRAVARTLHVPSPYGTTGIRLTNGSDCGGSDCVNYVGYSYWRNINNHAGSDTMLIFLGLNRNRGGGGPALFSYNKNSGETRNLGPLFSGDSPFSWSTGGWYFSASRAHGAVHQRYEPTPEWTSIRRRWKPSSTCASTSGPTSTSSRSTRVTTMVHYATVRMPTGA